MPNEARPPCSLCTLDAAAAELIFRRENRGVDQPWVHVETRSLHPICISCDEWVGKVTQSATGGQDPRLRGLGFPVSDRAPRSTLSPIRAKLREPDGEAVIPGVLIDTSPSGMEVRVGWLPPSEGGELEVRLDVDGFATPLLCRLLGSHGEGGQLVAHLAYPELVPAQEALLAPVLAAAVDPGRSHVTDDADASAESAERCDFCAIPLGEEAYAVDVMPYRGQFVRGFVYRHAGTVRQYRLCLGCWSWCRSLVFDDSAARGVSFRRDTGPIGSWLAPVAYDASAAFLSADDEHVLRTALDGMGRWCSVLGPAAARQFAGRPNEVLFINGSAKGRANELLQAIGPAGARRTVVLGRIDAMSDICTALGEGAGDFVISPLTPDQVAGAFERISQEDRTEGHDELTGLPIYRRVPGAYGQPCQVIAVTVGPSDDLRQTAWLLRRFLRGYDRVGASVDRGLEAHVYCPDEALRRVLERLRTLLGTHAKVSPIDRVEAEGGSLAA